MKRIFISYARDDYSFAHKFLDALQGVDVEGWMDSADIAAGMATSEGTRTALTNSSAVVVLVSPSALKSRWIDFEIGAGLALGKPIIPILITGADIDKHLPEPLRNLQVLDARNKSSEEIVRDVEKALSEATSAAR